MKIAVEARPGAKNETVKQIGVQTFKVCVKEAAREGRANQAIIKALAGHFGIPKSRIRIASGKTSKRKVLEIL
ncbi:MAG: DUF167 domain-containing protein [Candidatus Sungiibacteriota bacterium]